MTDHEALAGILDNAMLNRTAVGQLTIANPGLDARDGHAIQRAAIARRVKRGERVVGVKLGLTSKAKMQQVNVSEVIIGQLTDAMAITEGGDVALGRFIHPRIEPEIAFVLKRALPPRVSLVEAAAAVEAVLPALEVLDSRYVDFKFTLADVVADNTSAGAYVLGPPSPASVDISNLAMVLRFDGRPVQIGSSAAILGHPLRALVEAARLAETIGVPLEAGSVILGGASTAAVDLDRAGIHVSADVTGLGRVGVMTA
jgi:2-oxo-3-hexenedioate decarboxylase